MIYTSYFGNARSILDACPDACLISIAGKTPEQFNYYKFKPLMPLYSWWKEWHEKFAGDLESNESKKWYIKQYKETVLSKLDPLTTARQIKDIAQWHPVFILCYETPEKFCHRHIVAEWLNDVRIDCEEWKTN